MKNIVIIGCGKITEYIYKGLKSSETYNVQAVCDIEKNNAQKYINDGVKFFQDYKEMLTNCSIDYVLLLTHHYNRMPILDYLLKNKYNVICEKPIVCSRNEFKYLKNICDLYKNYPIIMYHRSYNKKIKYLYDVLNNKSVKEIEINYLENIIHHTNNYSNTILPDKNGGGCVCDNFPNCIHYLLKKGKVSFVESSRSVIKEHDYTSSAKIKLLFDDKILCRVNLDWHSKIDLKSIVVKTNDEIINIDLQEGYEVGKDSLYDEYSTFFKELNNYNKQQEFEIAEKIMELEENIFRS